MDKKKLNKILVSAFIGTALWSIGFLTKTKKWKKLRKKFFEDIKLWLAEMKDFFSKLKKKNAKKK